MEKDKKQAIMSGELSLTKEAIVKHHLELLEKVNDLLIEGLRLKGYEFKDQVKLKDFINLHCHCIDRMDLKQRRYFVKDQIFFIHYYEFDLIESTTESESIEVNFGYYSYE